MKVTIVAAARPNFMKVAPIIKAINAAKERGEMIEHRLVHTGQHFDKNMSERFFTELNIPEPAINLNAGGGTQAEQTAAIMVEFEKELLANRPDVVIVVGDVTSTMACAITAKKLCINVAHIEAGIRSGDMSMPEEINRIVTDSICDYFFTTTQNAGNNLELNGIDKNKIYFVGNTMIDTLHQNLQRLREPAIWKEKSLDRNGYFLLTLHRPNNVDIAENLYNILETLLLGTSSFPIVFPVHPRTKKVLSSSSMTYDKLYQTEPLGYLEFIYLLKNARGVITDSGGITEEATVLGIPCVTLRNSTERPETINIGTNELAGTDPENLIPYIMKMKKGTWKKGGIPDLWDGNTSEKIVYHLLRIYEPGI